MDLLYSIFFGAGVSAFIYTQAERRMGYGNQQSVRVITGVVFVLAVIVFYTILKFFLKPA